MSKYNFTGHKLSYHPQRVAQYLQSGDCYPLYAEISLVGSCNHRCLFCAYDFIGHPDRRLQTGRMLEIISEMAECGLKSIVFAGEGEPLLHPDIAAMIAHTQRAGIDVGLFTNGQLLAPALAERILPDLTFLRFSFNGGTADDYARVHQVKPAVFDRVTAHMRQAVRIRKEQGLDVDIGAQFVLIPENQNSLTCAAMTLKSAGLDYLAVKPYVHQRQEQGYCPAEFLSPDTLDKLLVATVAMAGDDFEVIVRADAFEAPGRRGYAHCPGSTFITVLNSAGDLATCLPYWDKPEFVFGNIYAENFRDIWQGPRRKALKHHLETNLDVRQCPPNCRPNAINAYLCELRNPSVRHVNFI